VFVMWSAKANVDRLERELTGGESLRTPPTEDTPAHLVGELLLASKYGHCAADSMASHFDLCMSAMKEIGADTRSITSFTELIGGGMSAASALGAVDADPAIERFVLRSLDAAGRGDVVEVLANFVFGREHMIPPLLYRLLDAGVVAPAAHSTLVDYADRHLEVDQASRGVPFDRAIAAIGWQQSHQAAAAA